MLIEITNMKGKKLGNVIVEEFNDTVNDMLINESTNNNGIFAYNNGFDDVYDTNDRKLRIEVNKDTTFETLNIESCVSPLEQELGAYKALKEAYLNKEYSRCSVLIKYYFGHINYGREFGYVKTHGEICLILYNNLLYSIEHNSEHFLNFINRNIEKIEWNIKNKEE